MSKHGIVVRDRSTGDLVEFIECETGSSALKILSGIRINLNHADYKAWEECIKECECGDGRVEHDGHKELSDGLSMCNYCKGVF